MRILYLSQYYPPEVGATQTRAHEMVRGLAQAGHEVMVITEAPNHPHGVIPPAYRGKAVTRSREDGVDVLRVWVKASPAKGFRARMAFYLSYMVMAAWAGLFLARGKWDLIYATSPPLFVGGAALAISYLRRIPLVFEVRDLWPESAVALGELNSPRAVRMATRLEEACYRRARHIVTATQGIQDRLLARGLPPEKVTTIPNGANTDLYSPRPPDPALRARLGLEEGQFVVLYTGLHGLAHGLETALEAAALLRDEPDIVFLFVGDGPRKPTLKTLAAELDLTNVRFHDAVPEPALPDILALGHLGLDTRRRLEISRGTLPVKMFSYMACSLPVLLAIEGEAADLLQEAGAGVVVPPESPVELATAIRALRDDPARRAEMGERGRAYVVAHYARQTQAARLEKLLRGVVGG